MSSLIDLKNEYNYWIYRNKKAEKYFTVEPIDKCMQHIKLFNDITINLSRLRTEIEKATNKKMTQKEILEGF